jgi:hypothetical protein
MAKIDNMMGPNVRMSTHVTTARATPDTGFGKRLQNGLNSAAGAVGAGIGSVAGMVPGGSIVSAAISSVRTFSSASGSGINGGTPYAGVMNTSVGAGGGVAAATAGLGGSVAPSTGVGGGLGVGTGVGADSTLAGGLAAGSSTSDIVSNNSFLNHMAEENMKLLNLQASMSQESQTFTALSNVMKARNDTIKNSIGNVR